MSGEFDKCVEKGKLAKFSRGGSVAENKLKEAFEDLKDAKTGFGKKRYKWATIQSYYAMFNAGNALLMKQGWREKNSHYCLLIGVKELYVSTGEMDLSYIEALQKGRTLRESASYHSEWSEDACVELLEETEKFLKKAGQLIKT